jgi:hypothetical protein
MVYDSIAGAAASSASGDDDDDDAEGTVEEEGEPRTNRLHSITAHASVPGRSVRSLYVPHGAAVRAGKSARSHDTRWLLHVLVYATFASTRAEARRNPAAPSIP